MFLQLNHQKLAVYTVSRLFIKECYSVTKKLRPEEKFGLISQIRSAALSVHLNIAEGASRKSEVERKRYYEIARGSVIEIDAALDAAEDLEYVQKANLGVLGDAMISCFKNAYGFNQALTIDYSLFTTDN